MSKESEAVEEALSPDDLKRYGLVTSQELKEEEFARILVLGGAKTGKTSCLVPTAPKPCLVINCDGPGATGPAARRDGDFVQLDANTRNSWKRACENAVKIANEGKVRTIIVDTFTYLADAIVEEASLQLDGYDLWREVGIYLQKGIRLLKHAAAHVIVVCHLDPEEDEIAGLTPLIPGKTRKWIPGALSDIVMFELDPEKDKRQILVGPQKYWTLTGRRIRRSCIVEPNTTALLEELGIEP